ncbi:MAG TPA: hydrolase 1, exosortase A system-associated [Allosphingosinicella sp.]|nr:hydrolase 1, exosortase A system-associated [Allosphingosinicella sp.]
MRRLIAFPCGDATLAGSVDVGEGAAQGVLLVIGGSQTRIGSHRMYERLAKALADKGYACFRYDRRGVGDSNGEDPGFRGSGPDLKAAADAFRREVPRLRSVIGFGLCDGASALALYGDEAGLDGLILANPWLVEAEEGAPAPAAIRAHYRKRLLSWEGWKRLLTGAVNFRKLWRGIRSLFLRKQPESLSNDVARALLRHRLPAEVILCRGDNTAIAADAEIRGWTYPDLIRATQVIETDSHTFARPGDDAMLLMAVETAMAAFAEDEAQAS